MATKGQVLNYSWSRRLFYVARHQANFFQTISLIIKKKYKSQDFHTVFVWGWSLTVSNSQSIGGSHKLNRYGQTTNNNRVNTVSIE